MCSKNSGSSSSRYFPAGMEDDDDRWDIVSSFEDNVKKTSSNMKIRIVPDPLNDAGLNGQRFDKELEPQILEWYKKFKNIWDIYKKSPAVSVALQNFYNSNDFNPFLYGLKLFANSPDFNSVKNYSLPFTIIEELNKYKKSKGPDIKNFIDDNLKMVAFNFVKNQGNLTLLKLTVETFNLTESNQLFVEKIREAISQKQYKEAAVQASELNLYQEFTIFDLVLPLFLQEKGSIAEDYMNKATHLRVPFVVLLDSLLDTSNSKIAVSNMLGPYIAKYDYVDVKLHKFQSKMLIKLVTRLIKLYDIKTELTPNVAKIKNHGALQFLLYKNFSEKTLNKDSWEEMVKETVPDDSLEIQLELVYGCCDFGDLSESAKWANYYKIDFSRLPSNVQSFIESNGASSSLPTKNINEESWDDDYPVCKPPSQKKQPVEHVHRLNLDDSRMILVDTNREFYNMLDYLKYQNLIAMDAEWKPSFNSKSTIALIQLATKDYVYLIDGLSQNFESKDWNNLGKYVLKNDEILKIGFAPGTDLIMFQNSFPSLNLSTNLQFSTSFLDLQEFWRKLNQVPNFQFPFPGENSSENLSNLVKLCLGKKLDKSNQFSNWEKRPLRNDQCLYAALDAFCLIEIYDVIEREMRKIGIDFNDFLSNFLYENKTKIVIKKKESSRPSEPHQKKHYPIPIGPNPNPVSAAEIKFVCDNMLEGLATNLRQYGIDAASITNQDYHDKCVRIALDENRFILTRGSTYLSLFKHLPLGHCYKVVNDKAKDQLEEVLKYFNVQVSQENIFTRCQNCNEDEFILINQIEMVQMKNDLDGSAPKNFVGQSVGVDATQRSLKLTNLTAGSKASKLTTKGAAIAVNKVPWTIATRVPLYYACQRCGKCYWDGTHLDSQKESEKTTTVLNINKK